MQAIHVNTGERLVRATIGMRAIALLIDVVLILIIAAIADYYTISSNETTFLWKPETFLYLLLGWLYFAGAESSSVQATLGKYLLDVKVVGKPNSRLTFKCATIRYFAKPLSLVIMLMRFVRGLPVANHRYFHNRVTDAYVVKTTRNNSYQLH
ncbi:RDD family protein [Pontibacter sp. KCTC 32443]|uniref:RDD family protein n=1 Tax=Pontibacter TaxID=323449 RepID=UPI00164DC16A|nr:MULTISPECIES: RDD family protein [Pontibacter]MBC5773809.1 RDD family protein [Pontibacter sp. KCTC 32443]